MAKENSTNNSLFHGGDDDHSPEDSGWTIYFEDLLNPNSNNHPNNSDHDQPTSFSSSSDLSPDQSFSVADAASSVADHKLPVDYDAASVDPGLSYKLDHFNFFKKRKMIKDLFVEDESLEDTASSPVNSPKVSADSTYFSKNHKNKHKENLIVSTPQVDERRSEMGFVGIGNDYTELKKRGLCLVPLSMVVNYMG